MPNDAIDLALGSRLSVAVDVGEGIEDVLTTILVELDGRAIGLWRAHEDELRLLGFAARDDMATDVQRGFREATSAVPLTMTRLGIVQAAINREPAISQVVEGDASLSGSPGWLARFDAVSSLAIPVFDAETLVAVIAVSSRENFDATTGGGPRLLAIADALVLFRTP